MSRGVVQGQTRSPQWSSGYTDPSFARIADLAHMFAGLVFPPNRQPSAEAGMRRAMSALHVSSPAQLLRVFETPGDARDAVLAELTVGESYFFRDEAQLQFINTEILPKRRESHGGARPLAVWSAGSASGEEPYTIALMLREQGWPHPSQVIATDIAMPRLAAARRGRYTRWALRGVSEERVNRWFTRTGNYFDLAPTVREMVEFWRLNLVVDEYPSAANGFDLVLCRNVMIYFDMPTVAHIAEGLLASLAPDGWLLLGASDPPLAHLVPCQSIMTAAGIAYRRVDAPHDAVGVRDTAVVASADRDVIHVAGLPDLELTIWSAESGSYQPTQPAPELETPGPSVAGDISPHIDAAAAGTVSVTTLAPPDALDDAYRRADYRSAELIAMTQLAVAPDSEPRVWIIFIRSVANLGRLNEAGELCSRALELHPLDAELHVLHATLLMEAGWFADAASAARRSIYLDRTLAMGHLLLGDALARSGEAAAARVAFTNARDLLANVDPDVPVAAADGVPSSRLRQIAASRSANTATIRAS
ncbi:hypothetical protein BH09GEM1_BH09GEM1_13000 [soil metagenome]